MLTPLKVLSILFYTGASIAFPAAPASISSLLQIVTPPSIASSSLHNIHIGSHDYLAQYLNDQEHGVRLTISSCDESYKHEETLKSFSKEDSMSFISSDISKLLWRSPSTHNLNEFCINGYVGQQLIGRSEPISFVENEARKRSNEVVAQMDDFDSLGMWFDGVAYVDKNIDSSMFETKSKESSMLLLKNYNSHVLTLYSHWDSRCRYEWTHGRFTSR